MIKTNNILEYKGYRSKIEFDTDSMVLHGKIENIEDLVTFECKDPMLVIEEFHSAVDDYLVFCKEVGKKPAKEYKGTFNVRIDPELHKDLATLAVTESTSLNSCVEDAIRMYLQLKHGQH